MPDPFSPAALNAAKQQAANRAGRSSTMLTQLKSTLAGGGASPFQGAATAYGGAKLGA